MNELGVLEIIIFYNLLFFWLLKYFKQTWKKTSGECFLVSVLQQWERSPLIIYSVQQIRARFAVPTQGAATAVILIAAFSDNVIL